MIRAILGLTFIVVAAFSVLKVGVTTTTAAVVSY